MFLNALKKNIHRAALPFLLSMPCVVDAGGISLDQTRVVFTAGEKARTVTVNNLSSQAYLIQSRVHRDLTDPEPGPFLSTPPLFVLQPSGRQLFRLILTGASLPADRESLFYLSVTAIPSQQQQVERGPLRSRLSLGLRFTIKLFYRPAGLAPTPEQAVCRLKVSRHTTGIRIVNPTPYFQTLGLLSINGHALHLEGASSMIAPGSHQDYVFSGKPRQTDWQIVNDYGALASRCHQEVT